VKNIVVRLEENKIDVAKLYYEFYTSVSDSTGTILIHHGKAKYPGKYKPDYTKIKLTIIDNEALNKINDYTHKIYDRFDLNKLFIVHQVGIIEKNDTILFLAAEAKDRSSAFDAIREILEFIKAETLIKLEEL